MNTLCTRATRFSSANGNHRKGCAEVSAHTRSISSTAAAKFKKISKSITQFFVIRYNRRIDRQAFENVLTLDDRALKDIGLTREDVMWASRLPLSQDAAMRLQQISRRR